MQAEWEGDRLTDSELVNFCQLLVFAGNETTRNSLASGMQAFIDNPDQLDLLTRYVGGEAPALSKMGGSDWSQAKSKARRAVRDIAVELVKLYSARMAAKASPPTAAQLASTSSGRSRLPPSSTP